jgi:hypothetical protein
MSMQRKKVVNKVSRRKTVREGLRVKSERRECVCVMVRGEKGGEGVT